MRVSSRIAARSRLVGGTTKVLTMVPPCAAISGVTVATAPRPNPASAAMITQRLPSGRLARLLAVAVSIAIESNE